MEGFPEEVIYNLEPEGLVRFGGKDLQTEEIIMHEDLKKQGNTTQEFFLKRLLTEIMKTLFATPKTYVLAVP